MGGLVSSKKKKKDPNDTLDKRIADMLKKTANSRDQDKAPGWNKIVLRFDQINKQFMNVKGVFDAADADLSNAIEIEELHTCLLKILKNREKEEYTDKMKQEVESIFTLADRSQDGALQFKEFLVCLALVHVLEVVPPHWTDGGSATVENETKQSLAGKREGVVTRKLTEKAAGLSLTEVFKLVIDAFLWFDEDASGFIEREEVMKMFGGKATTNSKAKKRGGSESVIGKQRWNEMDWNSDGKITFGEFLFAFSTWTGLDDEIEMAEEEAAEAAANATNNAANNATAAAATQ